MTAPENSSAMLPSVHAALPTITSNTSAFGTDRPRAEPADQRGVGDQEQAGFTQQGFRQIEERREHAGAQRQRDRGDAAEDGVGEQGAAQECGRMDHGSSPLVGGVRWTGINGAQRPEPTHQPHRAERLADPVFDRLHLREHEDAGVVHQRVPACSASAPATRSPD